MNRLGGLTTRRVLLGITALIVVGGFALALLSGPLSSAGGLYGSFGASSNNVPVNQSLNGVASNGSTGFNTNGVPSDTQVVGQVMTTTMTATASTTINLPVGGLPSQVSSNITQGSPSNGGGLIEVSTNLAITASTPQETASAISALAYSVGGYVAYQSTYTDSAYIVIRVPSADYQTVLGQVRGMGAFVSLSTNSNDVRVQYTDLNATLASLKAEQSDLLRFLNQSSNITTTLSIESQLQQVNSQINYIQSQILQTRTLIDYATINVTVTKTAEETLPTMILSASPKSGLAPLSVTFNANVKGGVQPYIAIYNFGDGSTAQGQIIIHTFYTPGDYNVTVNVTDQIGNSTSAWTMIHVTAAPAQSGLSAFFGNISGLFINVVEGIIEVAVVVLPIAAVGAAIIIPIQRRGRTQRDIKQSQ